LGFSSGERDMGGASAVAVDDRRQPLHMRSEYLRHRLLLGFAQFRELLGDVRHRTMMLTDLHTVDRTAHLGGGRDVTGFGQRAGNPPGGGFDFLVGIRLGRLDTRQDRVDALTSNLRTASSPPISRSCRIAADARSS